MFYFGWIIGLAIVTIIVVAMVGKLDKEGYFEREDRP